MALKWKWTFILALLVPCIGIGISYDVDLVTWFFAGRFAHYDLTRVYGLNWDLGPFFPGPVLVPFLEPFGTWSYTPYKAFSLIADSAWYLVIWFCLMELFPILKQRSTVWGWLMVFVLSINPFHQHFQSHQIQIFLAGVLFLAEYLRVHDKPKEFTAGFLVMFAAMVKLFPGVVVLYYLALGRKRLFWGLTAGFLFSLALPSIYFGFENGLFLYQQFLAGLSGYNSNTALGNDFIANREILNIHSFFARLFSAPYAGLISKSLSATIILSFLFSVTKHRRQLFLSRRESTHFWALAMALSVVLHPGTRVSFFMFLLPAFAALVEIYKTARVPATRFLVITSTVASTWALAFTTDFVLGKNLNNQMESWSVPTWGMLLCLGALLALTLKPAPTAA